jgi:hypothetical protein
LEIFAVEVLHSSILAPVSVSLEFSNRTSISRNNPSLFNPGSVVCMLCKNKLGWLLWSQFSFACTPCHNQASNQPKRVHFHFRTAYSALAKEPTEIAIPDRLGSFGSHKGKGPGEMDYKAGIESFSNADSISFH